MGSKSHPFRQMPLKSYHYFQFSISDHRIGLDRSPSQTDPQGGRSPPFPLPLGTPSLRPFGVRAGSTQPDRAPIPTSMRKGSVSAAGRSWTVAGVGDRVPCAAPAEYEPLNLSATAPPDVAVSANKEPACHHRARNAGVILGQLGAPRVAASGLAVQCCLVRHLTGRHSPTVALCCTALRRHP